MVMNRCLPRLLRPPLRSGDRRLGHQHGSLGNRSGISSLQALSQAGYPPPRTFIAVVIHQDDLLQQVRGCVIDGAVDRAQDHRQGLIHEDEDDGYLGQLL